MTAVPDPTAPRLRCESVGTLADVDPTEWNALASRDGLYSSHEWLTTVEAESPGCRYLVVRDDGGHLLAALPVYPVIEGTNKYYRLHTHFRGLPTTLGPAWLLGTSGGYRNAPLLDEDAPRQVRDEALRLIFRSVQEGLAETGGGVSGMLFVTKEGVDRLRPVDTLVHPALTYVGDAWLDKPGNGFDDYLRSLSTARRGAVRKEVRKFREAGMAVVLEDPRDRIDLVVRLVDQLNRKHGRVIPDDQQVLMLSRQFDVLGDQARLFSCEHAGTAVGVTLAYEWGDWLYLRLTGFDYGRLKGAYEYFNLNIYEPLRYCYERGLRGLHLGAASHDAKGARGARVEPLVSMLLTGGTADVGSPLPEGYRTRVAEYWAQQIAGIPRALDPDLWRRAMAIGSP